MIHSSYSCFKASFGFKWFNPRILTKTCSAIKAQMSSEVQLPSENVSNSVEPSSSLKYRSKRSVPLVPSEIVKEKALELRDSITSAMEINRLFNIYLENKNTYDFHHFQYSIKRLSELFKDSNMAPSEIHGNVVFQALSYDIWKVTSQLEVNTVLSIYLAFINLKVPTEALIMQSLLQMMRHQINLMTIKDLIFLHRLLLRTESCTLKDALLMSVPRVLDNSMQKYKFQNLKFNEINQICILGEVKGIENLLEYMYDYTLPELLQNEERTNVNKDTVSLLFNVLDLFLKTDYEIGEEAVDICCILSFNCLKQLSDSKLLGIEKKLILILLNKLGKCHSSGVPMSYVSSDEFLLLTTHIAVENQWDVNSLCNIINSHLKMNYLNEDLSSYTTSVIKQNLEDQSSFDLNILDIIPAIAINNIPEEESIKILDSIVDKYLTLDNLKILWVRIVLNLLSMNYIHEPLLEKVLDKDFLRRYINAWSNSRREYFDVLRLDRALKAMVGNPKLRVPSELRSTVEDEIGPPKHPSLRGVLERVIGGNFLTSVVTPNGNFIDHLVIIDEEGKPMENTAEGISSKRKIALVEIPSNWTVRPGTKIRGFYKIELILLEMEGFTVVPLYENEMEDWQEAAPFHLVKKLQKIGIKTCL